MLQPDRALCIEAAAPLNKVVDYELLATGITPTDKNKAAPGEDGS